MALLVADAFVAQAKPFRDKAFVPFDQLTDAMNNDIPGLVTAATSMSFALEIYLKAIAQSCGVVPPDVHDLNALYKCLPTEVKSAVTKRYEKLFSPHPFVSCSIIVNVSSGQAPGNEKPQSARVEHTVEAVLRRSRHGFVVWRYFFQRGVPGQSREFVYEYVSLHDIGTALRKTLLERLTGDENSVVKMGPKTD